jgi:hypothetical protein
MMYPLPQMQSGSGVDQSNLGSTSYIIVVPFEARSKLIRSHPESLGVVAYLNGFGVTGVYLEKRITGERAALDTKLKG